MHEQNKTEVKGNLDFQKKKKSKLLNLNELKITYNPNNCLLNYITLYELIRMFSKQGKSRQ